MKQARSKKEHAVYEAKEPVAAYSVSKPVTNMLSKSTVINSVKDLPNNFTIDELIERLLFIQSVEKGQKDSKEGNVYSETEAKKRLKKWLR